MNKNIAILGLLAFALFIGSAYSDTGDEATTTATPPYCNGPGFVDADGDGICDNYGTGYCGGGGCGTGFVDEDGDGICDNAGQGCGGYGRGRGCGGGGCAYGRGPRGN